MIRSAETKKQESQLQLFVYRLPRKNHADFLQLTAGLGRIFHKNGTLRSEFFQLNSTKAFDGFTNIGATVATSDNEEVWIEIDHYKDRHHLDETVAKIGKDPEADRLFGKLMQLITQGYSIVMGEFERVATRN